MIRARLLVTFGLVLLLAACGSGSSGSEEQPQQQQAPPPQEPGSTVQPAPGLPISAPAETWTWVDFPDSACADGSPTGIGVNFTERSTDLMVFFAPGGACWDFFTCFVLQTAVDIGGYDAQDFAAEPILRGALWNREDPANPFRDANFVFIPYCTGDIFGGNAVRSYDPTDPNRRVHHVGARNVQQFVDRLAATFPQTSHVWLAGESAGGYGAQVNYERFAAGFPLAQVDALSDSAPVLQPQFGLLGQWKAAWNIQAPQGCEGRGSPGGDTASCLDNFPALVDFLATRHPAARFGLLAFTRDPIIGAFFGYSTSDSGYTNALEALLRDEYDSHANTKYFVLDAPDHVMLGRVKTLTTAGGVTLESWVQAWATGAGWTSAR